MNHFMIAYECEVYRMGKLITSKELQEIYSLSRATIDRWRKEGMPSMKVGRGVRFDEEAVREWISENKQSE